MSRSLAQFHSGRLDEWNLLDSRESWVLLGSWAFDAPDKWPGIVKQPKLVWFYCPKFFFYPWEFIWTLNGKYFLEREWHVFAVLYFHDSKIVGESFGMDPVPHGATHRRINMTTMTESRHHFPCSGIWLTKDAWLQLFPCWWKNNSLHGLIPVKMSIKARTPSWTFRIQIWAVRWKKHHFLQVPATSGMF